MDVDIGNALGTVPGLTEATLDRLDGRVADAHDRIERGRAAGEHGYAALNLPDTADVDAIRAALSGFDPSAVLVVGIGGSALGAATLADALGGAEGAPAVHVLDNVDPAHAERLLAALPPSETVAVVVSRSGTTTETLANFTVVRGAMEAAGVDWTDRTVAITGPDGPLRRLARRHDLPALDVPAGVPGRFGVLSTVGLGPAVLAGVDAEAVLAGAADAAATLSGSLYDCPAYAYGATAYALARRGAVTNAVMPYAESLETFAEWVAQLWAESLGKDGLGQTPARALGATDQHSQLQLYRGGRRDKLVTLVRPTERPAVPIPEPGSDPGSHQDPDPSPNSDADVRADLAHLGGATLGDVIDAEFAATEASLAAADRPNVRIEVDRIDARSIGRLLYGLEAACVLYGELAGVETFTQPAVEWGKRAARGLLGGAETPEAAAASDKRELRVTGGGDPGNGAGNGHDDRDETGPGR